MIDCTFENGNKAHLRHVTVGIIAINSKNQVLLVRRSKTVVGEGKLTIPGGFLDQGENTAEGALRELMEETGYSGKIKTLFQINDNPRRPKEDRQNIDFIYLAELGEQGEIKTPEEVKNLKWFSKDNLPEDEEFAFDHRNIIIRFFEYLENKFNLPIIGPV